MKKEWLLLLASTSGAVLIALTLIRWLTPGLLGISKDLRLVQVSDEVPPFYDNVFRAEDLDSADFIINDPIVIARAKPLFESQLTMGPNDLLGFRNRAVPNVADIVAIGDSQTYGNNALLEESWPSRLGALARPEAPPVVYNMSCGAWSGPQYLEILRHALRLRPRVVVIAFYTGNDPVGAFSAAYGSPHFRALRLREDLSAGDAPQVDFPPPQSQWWSARFSDESTMVFTPTLRLTSNLRDDAAVQTGWKILGEVVRRAASMTARADARLVVTVIPTKELAHARRVAEEISEADPIYTRLVDSERRNIEDLAGEASGIAGVTYVDVAEPLLAAAMTGTLYPSGPDGHPLARGYDVIARALAGPVASLLPVPPEGLVFVAQPGGHSPPILVRGTAYRMFASREIFVANGWASTPEFKVVQPRELASLRFEGTISTVDPVRFGPSPRAAER